MGAFSTLRVSRRKAMERLAEHRFSGITDEELAAWLDTMLAERLYNVRIVSEGEAADDGHYAIEDIG